MRSVCTAVNSITFRTLVKAFPDILDYEHNYNNNDDNDSNDNNLTSIFA